MNYSSTSKYSPREEYLYRAKETLQVVQAPFLTHKSISTAPVISYPADKYDYREPSTSVSLGSYKQMSPIRSYVQTLDLFDSFKRFAEIAISNHWTKATLDAKWPGFESAAKSINSKLDLEDYFREVVFKPEKKRPKSAPGSSKRREQHSKVDRFERPKMPGLQRHHSYNYEVLHRHPVKTQIKSKSVCKLKHPGLQDLEKNDKIKKVAVRQTKIQKLCERIEQGFARGMKTLTSRATLY